MLTWQRVAAAVAGLIVGVPALRLKGHYFSVGTFIVGIIITILMTNLDDLTRGPMGLTGIPFVKIQLFGIDHVFRTIIQKVGYYYFVLAFAALVLLLRWRIGRSRFGRALTAIKGDENLAESVGIATYRVKVTAFTIAAALAGVAGSLYAHYAAFISPDSFTFVHSFDLFVMNLLGGAGTLAGPIIGPIFLTVISTGVKSLSPAMAQIVYGVLLIVVIVVLPTGIAGGIAPRILPFLKASPFRERFERKGRFQDYLAAIPSKVIVHPHAALLGAARVAFAQA